MALAARSAQRQGTELADQRVEEAARLTGQAVARSLSALAGADSLAADGAVSSAEFEAFARGVLKSSAFEATGFSEPVLGSNASDFEARRGIQIKDLAASGDLVPGVSRAQHVVVTDIEPQNDDTRPLVGFDLMSSPTRSATLKAASASDRPAISGPVVSAASTKPGIFVAAAIRDPQAVVVSYISGALAFSDLLSSPSSGRPPFSISDGSQVLYGQPVDGARAVPLEIGGRTWRIRGPASDPDFTLALLIGGFTVAAASGLGASLGQSERNVTRNKELMDLLEGSSLRIRLLAELAERLAICRSTEETARVVSTLAAGVLDADQCEVGRRGQHGIEMFRDGAWVSVEEGSAVIGAATVPAVPEVARSGKVTLTGDEPTRAVVPIVGSDSGVIGVLEVTWRERISLDGDLRTTLDTVVRMCGQTLERTELSTLEHSIVEDLQERLLVPMPEVAGIEIEAIYRPASGLLSMGGDWYDGIVLPDGSLVVVIGDVTGHGVRAVAAMAQLQSVTAGLLRAGAPLESLFSLASATLERVEPTYATAQLLHLDPAGGRLRYLSAGHPFALLRLPDGTVERLEGARQPLLGVPLSSQPLAEMAVPRGSIVVAYTDGLVERRDETLFDGIDRLAAALSEVDASAPVGEVALALTRACAPPAGTTQEDDIALVVVRLTA